MCVCACVTFVCGVYHAGCACTCEGYMCMTYVWCTCLRAIVYVKERDTRV